MLSGGSTRSWSETSFLLMVTVHCSAPPKSTSGLIVKVVGPPVVIAVCSPLLAHDIWIQFAETFTGSSNVTVISVLLFTPVAPLAGDTPSTTGDRSPEVGQALTVVELLRGLGVLLVKLLPFWSVSLQPPRERKSAVAFVKTGAAAVPSKQSA